jgi:hypothetical protein
VRLRNGAQTTVHIARYEIDRFTPRVVLLDRPLPLARWCNTNHVLHAVVGGFFIRPHYAPLGELRLAGVRQPSIPFDPPWGQVRACVHIVEGDIRITRRDQISHPGGDLLQAGPLLLSDGQCMIEGGHDPEGFSAGAHQFDSDITVGRYPRAALATTESSVLGVVCDGRSAVDAGLTLRELSDVLAGLGAVDALNLDGGGSATLVHDGRLQNRPREQHGAELLAGRAVATAIAFEPSDHHGRRRRPSVTDRPP